MFERFTERARRVMVLAQEEARLLNHNFIGTEHLLLGLIREGDGVAAKALAQLGMSFEAVREKVEETMGAGPMAADGSLPFTPRAKKVLELSLREGLQLGHNYIGTEHILLGLLREGEGVAAHVLVDLGADLSRVREKVIQLSSGRRSIAPEDQSPMRYESEMVQPIGASSGTPPDCPHCRSGLETSAGLHRLPVVDEVTGTEHVFLVVYCQACGRSLAFKPTV